MNVPNTDLILDPHGKNLTEAGWEADAGHWVRHRRHEAADRVEALAAFDRIEGACGS